MARSTKRNELRFLISARVPSFVSPLRRTDTLASQRKEPSCILPSQISRYRTSECSCFMYATASLAERRSGSETISSSGVPARLRYQPVGPWKSSWNDLPACCSRYAAPSTWLNRPLVTRQAQLLSQAAPRRIAQRIQCRVLRAFQQIIVASNEIVHQFEFERAHAVPELAGGNGGDIELRSVGGEKIFEQGVGLVQLFFQFGAALFGVFAEQGERALVFAGGVELVIDVVLFEQAVEIGQLRDHTNGADDGKGRRENAVGDARHQITAAGRDLIHRHHQGDAGLLDAGELRGGEAV